MFEQLETRTKIRGKSGFETRTKTRKSNKDIEELLGYWSKTQSLVEKWHPSTAVVNRSLNLFNDNVMQHIRKNLKNR
jgi:hypothetical protein